MRLSGLVIALLAPQSGEKLLEVLTARDEVGERLERLSVYASMIHDVDTVDPRGQALSSRIDGLWSRFNAATAYVAPEMLQIPPDLLRQWRDSIPGLALYPPPIDETLRLPDPLRSAEGEEGPGGRGGGRGAGAGVFRFLRNPGMAVPT